MEAEWATDQKTKPVGLSTEQHLKCLGSFLPVNPRVFLPHSWRSWPAVLSTLAPTQKQAMGVRAGQTSH